MNSWPKHLLLHLVVISLVLSSGCSSDDNTVEPGKRLCGGASGLAARIAGIPGVSEICVSDDNTTVIYTPAGAGIPAGRYETTSVFKADSVTIEVSTMFYAHDGGSTPLDVTGNRAEAEFNPDGFWFSYRETKTGDYDVISTTVTGAATLTFNELTIAVLSFVNLEISLVDAAAPSTDAGTRRISEGYLNVTVDSAP
ncbi:MAG: hypothetical protein P8181_08615 [bacterium]